MAKRSDMDHGLLLLIVAILAWLVPGAGHFFIKEKKRAAIIFVTIMATFAAGLSIGSIAVVDPVGAWPWYIGQMLTTPAVAILGDQSRKATRKWDIAKRNAQIATHETTKAQRESKRAADSAKEIGSASSMEKASQLKQAAQKAREKSTLLTQQAQDIKFVSYGRPHDFGQIYTAIAGAMNLLAILSAVYMAHSGRGEMIGSEEDE